MMGNVDNSAWQILVLCLWLVIAGASLQTDASSNFQEHGEDTGRLQRKLLTDEERQTNLSASNPKVSDNITSSSWPILLGLLFSVLSVAFLTMLVVKFRIVQRFCGGYSEALLPEGDTVSQISQPGTLPSYFPGHDMTEREQYTDRHEDDDGFIEDNYISASDKKRAQIEEGDEESDDELEIHFSIE